MSNFLRKGDLVTYDDFDVTAFEKLDSRRIVLQKSDYPLLVMKKPAVSYPYYTLLTPAAKKILVYYSDAKFLKRVT